MVTVMDELAYSLQGTNAQYGTPCNPAAPERIPGGSSSGEIANVFPLQMFTLYVVVLFAFARLFFSFLA
jgi:hypothetical protein